MKRMMYFLVLGLLLVAPLYAQLSDQGIVEFQINNNSLPLSAGGDYIGTLNDLARGSYAPIYVVGSKANLVISHMNSVGSSNGARVLNGNTASSSTVVVSWGVNLPVLISQAQSDGGEVTITVLNRAMQEGLASEFNGTIDKLSGDIEALRLQLSTSAAPSGEVPEALSTQLNALDQGLKDLQEKVDEGGQPSEAINAEIEQLKRDIEQLRSLIEMLTGGSGFRFNGMELSYGRTGMVGSPEKLSASMIFTLAEGLHFWLRASSDPGVVSGKSNQFKSMLQYKIPHDLFLFEFLTPIAGLAYEDETSGGWQTMYWFAGGRIEIPFKAFKKTKTYFSLETSCESGYARYEDLSRFKRNVQFQAGVKIAADGYWPF